MGQCAVQGQVLHTRSKCGLECGYPGRTNSFRSERGSDFFGRDAGASFFLEFGLFFDGVVSREFEDHGAADRTGHDLVPQGFQAGDLALAVAGGMISAVAFANGEARQRVRKLPGPARLLLPVPGVVVTGDHKCPLRIVDQSTGLRIAQGLSPWQQERCSGPAFRGIHRPFRSAFGFSAESRLQKIFQIVQGLVFDGGVFAAGVHQPESGAILVAGLVVRKLDEDAVTMAHVFFLYFLKRASFHASSTGCRMSALGSIFRDPAAGAFNPTIPMGFSFGL